MARMTRGRYSSGTVGCVADLVLDGDYRVHLDQAVQPAAPAALQLQSLQAAPAAVNVAVCG